MKNSKIDKHSKSLIKKPQIEQDFKKLIKKNKAKNFSTKKVGITKYMQSEISRTF